MSHYCKPCVNNKYVQSTIILISTLIVNGNSTYSWLLPPIHRSELVFCPEPVCWSGPAAPCSPADCSLDALVDLSLASIALWPGSCSLPSPSSCPAPRRTHTPCRPAPRCHGAALDALLCRLYCPLDGDLNAGPGSSAAPCPLVAPPDPVRLGSAWHGMASPRLVGGQDEWKARSA